MGASQAVLFPKMGKIVADHSVAARPADGELIRETVDVAIPRAQRAICQRCQGALHAAGEFARFVQLQVGGLEFVPAQLHGFLLTCPSAS